MNKTTTFLAALLLSGTAFAQSAGTGTDASDLANAAIAADLGSTAIGLSMGFTEMNPLGAAVIPLKFIMKAQIEKISDEDERREAMAQFTGAQFGAAAANLCTLAAGHPAIAVVCFLGAARYGYNQVKAIPTRSDCVNKHMAKLEEAAAAGRVYRVVFKGCEGRFEDAPMVAQGTAAESGAN